MEDPISVKDIRIMKELIEKKMNNSQKIQIIDIIKNNKNIADLFELYCI